MEHIYIDDEMIEFRNQLRQYKDIGTKKVISILRRLQLAKISIAQLQATKISQTINSLSSITDFADDNEGDIIKNIASQIISKWKKFVEESKATRFKKTSDSSASKSSGGNNSNSSQQAKKKTIIEVTSTDFPGLVRRQISTGSTETTLSKDLPEYSEDREVLPIFKSDTRKMGLNAIFKYFDKIKSEMNVTKTEWVDLSVKLEQAIFLRSSQVASYRSNVKEVLGMFTSNQVMIEVITKLLLNEVKIEDVAEAKSTVFLTDQRKAEIQKQQEVMLAVNDPEFYNNIRKQRLMGLEGEICKGCKKKTAFLVKELQTRSADEPMTRFMECNNCGKSWRD